MTLRDNSSYTTKQRYRGSAAGTMRWSSMLMRSPALSLAALYSIAICFERIVDIEYFKPYRLIGLALIALAIFAKKPSLDGISKRILIFILIGATLGTVHVLRRLHPATELLGDSMIWIFNVGTYIAIYTLIRSRRELTLLAVIHAAAMSVGSLDMYSHSAALQSELDGAVVRVSGDFKNPAAACLSLLVAALLLVTTFRRLRHRIRNALLRMLVPLCVGVILLFFLYVASLTGSRSGAGLYVMGMAVYFLITSGRKMMLVILLLALPATISINYYQDWGTLSEGNVLAKRIETKGADYHRLYLWRSGLDAYVDSWGMGLGIGQYRTVHQEYYREYAEKGDYRWLAARLSLHSDYVSALVEFGFLGFVVFLSFCAFAWRMVSRIKAVDVRALGLAFLMASAVNAITHTILIFFSFWFYLALLACWVRVEQCESGKERYLLTFAGDSKSVA